MGVYIKGMEMPKEGSWKTVRIYPDGTCAVPNWQGDCTLIQGAKAVPIPPQIVHCCECEYNNHCLTQEFVGEESKIPFDRNTFFCADGKREEQT